MIKLNQKEQKTFDDIKEIKKILDMMGCNGQYNYKFPFSYHSHYVREYSRIDEFSPLPGQRSFLHGVSSVRGPTQSLPPCAGAGLLHFLVRICVPPPQLLVHAP